MKSSLIIYLLMLLAPSGNFSQLLFDDYCNMSCGSDKPVMCKRRKEKCRPAADCDNLNEDSLMSMEQKHLIMHLHNKLRNQMALGLYNDLVATDMQELIWDDGLEDMAVCWANTCRFQVDTCIRTLDNQEAGQNIALLNSTQLSRGVMVALEIGLHGWFNERSLVHLGEDHINSYSGYLTRGSSDFTQAIWAKTQFIGCGRAFIGKMNEKLYLVCNYSPGGNIPGEKIYTIGKKPCLDCPEIVGCAGECSYVWTSLCKATHAQRNDRLYMSCLRNTNAIARRFHVIFVSVMVDLLLSDVGFLFFEDL